jgi:hypothetical protein
MGRARSTNGDKINTYNILVGNIEGKRPLEDLDVSGRIILRWILEKQDRVLWTGII